MSRALPLVALLCALVALPAAVSRLDTDVNVSGRTVDAGGTTVVPTTATPVKARDTRSVTRRAGDENVARRLVEVTNNERRARGLSPVTADARLQTMAGEWSNNLRGEPLLVHRDVKGRVGKDELSRYTRFGENLYKTNGDLVAEDVHRAWMASPGHRQNIVDPNWDRIGIGVAREGDVTYVTQNFGRAR